MWEIALPVAAAGSGAAWALLAARRAGERGAAFTARALVAGVAAFGIAWLAYDAARLAGLDVTWGRLVRGDAGALLLALVIGLVEEAAKLAGLLLVARRGLPLGAVLASAAGVAGGFSALEALLVLHGETSAPAFARAALGPVAHAVLMIPLAFGARDALRRTRLRWLPLAPALAAAATLHGMGDLSLALPWLGSAGYFAALAAPTLVLFARGYRRSPPRRAVPALPLP